MPHNSDLLRYFNVDDFKCHCGCGYIRISDRLLNLLLSIQLQFKKFIKIHSACRCPIHNKKVGGVKNSYHLRGLAVDISLPQITPDQIYRFIRSEHSKDLGLGIYRSFIHIDCRKIAYDWSSK